MDKHSGGRLAAKLQSAYIAEELVIHMLRPFAALAPVPREEDYPIDTIGTLLHHASKVSVAEKPQGKKA